MYIYEAHDYNYLSSRDPIRAEGTFYPIIVGGRVFDKNNVGTISVTPEGGGTTGTTVSPRTFNGAGITVQISKIVSSRNQQYGFTHLIYSADELSSTYFTKLETATLSGRFRFKETFTAIPHELWGGTLDLTVSINNKIFKALTFPVRSSAWYDGNKDSALWWDKMNANDRKNISKITTIGGYGELPVETTTPSDYVPMFSTSMESKVFTADYAQSVWDFGSGQIVPTVFRDWVVANSDPIYPYTYTVKSQNGTEVLSTRVELPPMSSARISVIETQKTLTLTGVNGEEYLLTWETPEPPTGKQFLGLAYAPNKTRASIPNGRTTPVTWDGNQTLYEVYGTYRPPVTTFDINLYQCSAEVNRVDKSSYLTSVGVLSGVLREECSIVAPTITFRQDSVPTFNYVYIAAFDRYYFVTGITSVSKNIWRMSLSCDVLMTWKDDIGALTAIIARQELYYNTYLIDAELPAQANQQIEVRQFPILAGEGFDTSVDWDYSFVLTVVGG